MMLKFLLQRWLGFCTEAWRSISYISNLCNLRMANDSTKYDPRSYAIIGAAMEVHRVLGCGFLEPVIRKPSLSNSLNERSFIYAKQAFGLLQGVELNVPYRPDFICFANVVVELKALARISGIEESQVIII